MHVVILNINNIYSFYLIFYLIYLFIFLFFGGGLFSPPVSCFHVCSLFHFFCPLLGHTCTLLTVHAPLSASLANNSFARLRGDLELEAETETEEEKL